MPDLSTPIRKTLTVALTVCLALLVALVGPAGLAAAQTRNPTPDSPAAAPPVTTLRVQTPAYELDGRGLRVPGYGTNSLPGAPALPVWSTTVELPATGAPVVTVTGGATAVIDRRDPLPAAPVPQPPAPNPLGGPAGGSADVDQPAEVLTVDQPDPAIYAADAFYPAALVETGAVQWQGGRRLLPLRVFPFQYNPVAGTLRYYADLSVTVRVQESHGDASRTGVRGQGTGDRGQETEVGSQGALNPAALPQTAGGSLRIRTGARGMYRLSYDALVAVDPAIATADPATFAVSYLGTQVAIRVVDHNAIGQWDSGDLVVFYAEPYQGRYDTRNVYWFTYGGAGSPRMDARPVTPAPGAPVVTEIAQTLHIEPNVDYRSTYHRPKEADHWFDTQLYTTSDTPIVRNYALTLDDAVTGAPRQVTLRALVHGGAEQAASPDQSMQILLNGNDVGLYQLGGSGLYQWEGSTDTTVAATLPATWLSPSSNQVSLVAVRTQLPGLSYYWISPDYVELTYPALADADGTDRIYIEGLRLPDPPPVAPDANEVRVTGFTTAAVGVYNISEPLAPVQLTTTAFASDTGTLSFWDTDLSGPQYYLSTEAALLAPAAIEKDTSSTWGTPGHTADYIAIVYRDPIPNPKPDLGLWGAVDPLLAHRADPLGDNFSVAKVDVQDIYDEFNYGRRDPEAIRDFLAYAYQNWNGAGPRPLYVLLVGSGTYDYTGSFAGATKPNLIPPYLVDVDPWIGEVPADNRYVSVDPPVGGVDDFLPDMHIGRIPAQNAAQVTAAVDKILAYENETTAPPGDWQRRVVYVADDCNNYAEDFNALSENVRLNWLPGPYDDRTVYYGDPTLCPKSSYANYWDMTPGISQEFDNGAFMVQWFGHGSRFRWGDAGPMFSNKDVPPDGVAPDLSANTVWPITFSYTCWTGYFVNMHKLGSYNYMDQTLGESLLLTDKRGSVADLSPSGQHVGGALLALNQGITQAIFTDEIDRMGPAVDAGKLTYWAGSPAYPDVIDTSILFGDPATRLRLPPLTPPAATAMTAISSKTAITLNWQSDSRYKAYEVWRSKRPYFSPDDLPDPADADMLRKIGTVTSPPSAPPDPPIMLELTDDPSGIGNVATNYFYVIRGVGANATADSDPVGEFDFALTPGN